MKSISILNFKNNMITVCLLSSLHLSCMEQPPQPLQKYNLATFSGLPADIKEYLLPFVVSGRLKDMTRGLYNIAALNKKHHAWINDEQRMVKILGGLDRVVNCTDIISTLEKKPKSLPMMRNQKINSLKQLAMALPLKNGQELIKAIQASDQKKIDTLLHFHDIDLNYQNFGYYPLRVAIQSSDEALVKKLLYAGADPNLASDMDGQRPIMDAAHMPMGTRILRMLLDAGAKVNVQDKVGRTPLSYAIQYGNVDAVRILLAAGAFLKKDKTYSFDWARMHLEKRNYQEIAKGIDREEYAYQEIAAILERYERLDESGQCKKAKYNDAYYPGDRFGMHCAIA